jgi:hypothetical protein
VFSLSLTSFAHTLQSSLARTPATGDDVIVHLDGRDRSEFELLPLTDLCAYQAAP